MSEIRECLTLQLLIREETWSISSFFNYRVHCIEVKHRGGNSNDWIRFEWENTDLWKKKKTYWFPNSEDINKNPVFKTHMADATGMVSKYFSRISVTWQQQKKLNIIQSVLSSEFQKVNKPKNKAKQSKKKSITFLCLNNVLTYHFFISLKCHLEDVSLLSLCEEKEHRLGLVGGWADKYHAALRIIQVIL